MPVWSFNRGEWSEAYVFLKLLGTGRIYGANANFEMDPATFMDIIEILRFENKRDHDKILKFKRNVLGNHSEITASSDDVEFHVFTSDEMSECAERLYNLIRTLNGQRKIELPQIQNILETMRFSSPKAPTLTNEQSRKFGSKADIILTTQDSTDHACSTNGFSIKSHVGSPSTLLNFSDGSNMIYKVNGCTEEIMYRLNAIESQNAMIATIKDDERLSLEFINSNPLYDRRGNCLGSVFGENLAYVDTQMLKVINEAVLILCGYSPIVANSSDIKDITNAIAEINPLGIRNNSLAFYQAKFKDLLFASFSGMTASTPWDGRKDLTGGYIDVSRSGELLYYRALSNDIFTSYLFEHTYMDKPQRGKNYDLAHQRAIWTINGQPEDENIIEHITSTIPKKGDCAYVYYTDRFGEPCYCLNLNFQIRFR